MLSRYSVGPSVVVSVPGRWLQSIVYMFPSVEAAQKGERAGGTGFILSVPCDVPGQAHHYVVTNSHVIFSGQSPVVRMMGRDGSPVVLPFDPDDWSHHDDGDDLAVHPIRYGAAVEAASVPVEMLLTEELATKWSLGPGDETFMIGRYVDLDGRERNEPVVRFGNVSAFPGVVVHQRERGFDQLSVPVEVRSLSGFSGSPVFVAPGPYVEPDGAGGVRIKAITGQPVFLLGVDWGHHHWREPVRDADGTRSAGKTFVQANSGMSLVVPGWKLQSLLYSDDLVAERAEAEATGARGN